MKLSKRELALLIIMLVIAAGALYYTQFYTPVSNEIADLKQKADSLAIQVMDAKTKSSKIPEIEAQLETLEQEFVDLTRNFLTGWDEPVLLVHLEDLIGDMAEKTSISLSTGKAEDYFSDGMLDLTLNTDYNSLKAIINALETSNYFNKPIAINISSSGEGTDALNVSLSLRFFTLNEPDPFQDDYDFMDGQYGKENIFK